MMEEVRVLATSSHQVSLNQVLEKGVRGEDGDVGVLATRNEEEGRICVMIWHYHDDDCPRMAAGVDMVMEGLDWNMARVSEFRIDETHSNAFTAWKNMGSPQTPTEEQYTDLIALSKLKALYEDRAIRVRDHCLCLKEFELPSQGVSLIIAENEAG
jgi:xylan 1,4-beta-xylosidase